MMRAGIAAALLAVVVGAVWGAGGTAAEEPAAAAAKQKSDSAAAAAGAAAAPLPPRVNIEVLTAPAANCTSKAGDGDTLAMYYSGALEDGTVFIASPRGDDQHTARPMTFTVGAKQVLPGWEQGVLGMCVGERRRITIPPQLGFGLAAVPISATTTVPANSTLLFEVELVAIEQARASGGGSGGSGSGSEVTAGGDGAATGADDLRSFFDAMDADKSGKLSKAELAAHMRTIKVATKAGVIPYTDDEIAKLIEKHHGPNSPNPDRDGDGEISWEEWDPSK